MPSRRRRRRCWITLIYVRSLRPNRCSPLRHAAAPGPCFASLTCCEVEPSTTTPHGTSVTASRGYGDRCSRSVRRLSLCTRRQVRREGPRIDAQRRMLRRSIEPVTILRSAKSRDVAAVPRRPHDGRIPAVGRACCARLLTYFVSCPRSIRVPLQPTTTLAVVRRVAEDSDSGRSPTSRHARRNEGEHSAHTKTEKFPSSSARRDSAPLSTAAAVLARRLRR